MPARRFFKNSQALLILILSGAFPLNTISEICGHRVSIGVDMAGTNALGQLVWGKTHPGHTVHVYIRVTMADDCQGDYTLVTNVTDTVNAQCVSFTTSNLVTNPTLLMFQGQYFAVNGAFAHTYIVPDCGSNDVVYHTTEVFARDTNSTTNPNGLLYSGASAQIRILRPNLSISERRFSTVGQDEMQWEATLTNTGNTELTDVSVLYSSNGLNQLVWGPGELAAGQVTTFRGTQPTVCESDMLVAEGTDFLLHRVSSTNRAAAFPSLLSVQLHREPGVDPEILVRWPARFSCFSLEGAPMLPALNWVTVQAPPLLTNDEVIMMLPATNQSGFFRLIRR